MIRKLFVFIDQGMFRYMSTEHLLMMVDCLSKSHRFARQFNTNSTQRNVLWKAGFRGPVRPNLLKQETQSLACAVRILFRLYHDDGRQSEWASVANKLTDLGKDALEYYVTLETESHRDAWSPLMLLLLSKINQLSDEKVHIISWIVLTFFPFLNDGFVVVVSSLRRMLVDGTSFCASWSLSN